MSEICDGVCQKFKKSRRFDTTFSKYCQNCNMFIEYEGHYCPCCSLKLRHNPRNTHTEERKKLHYRY